MALPSKNSASCAKQAGYCKPKQNLSNQKNNIRVQVKHRKSPLKSTHSVSMPKFEEKKNEIFSIEQKNEHIASLESMNEKLMKELNQNKESNQKRIAEIQEELTKVQNENIRLNDQISNDLQT